MTYDTIMESDAINIILKAFPKCEIVNPNIPEHQDSCRNSIGGDPTPGKEIGYFLELTEPCNIGCFFQYYTDKWSAGSATEANYMLENNKPIFQIDIIKQMMTRIIQPVEAYTFKETLGKLVESGVTQYM